MEREQGQVEKMLASIVATVKGPGRTLPPLDDAFLATGSLPVLVPGRVKRWARAGWMTVRAMVAWAWVPPWDR